MVHFFHFRLIRMHETPTDTSKRRRLFYLLLPVLILIGGYATMHVLASMKEEAPRRTPPPTIKPVRVEVVRPGAIAVLVEALGRVGTAQPVQLVSEVTGLVEAGDVPFRPGSRFREGQLLLRIDARQAQLTLNSLKSDFLNALAAVLPEIKIDFPSSFEIWQKYFDACGFQQRLPELPEANERNLKLLLTRAQVFKLYYAVRQQEIVVEKHSIRAPFNGSLIAAALHPGSVARAGAPLGDVISLDGMEVELPIPSADLSWIARGQRLVLRSQDASRSWTAEIVRIGSAIDRRSQSIPAYARILGDASVLHEGMYVNAEIAGRTLSNATRVPRRAVYENSYVYVLADGRLERRDVRIAASTADALLVDAGLRDGDSLVVELLQGVAPGMRVVARDDAGRAE